jgi:L-ascorbate metabolism protein UlaG (beta-lactamase superfamily)
MLMDIIEGGMPNAKSLELGLTYVGGPTCLLEFGGFRLLTDPTFDAAPTEYPSGAAILRKLTPPAVGADTLKPIDCVLLSHDHHADNLDRAGRDILPSARAVVTTEEGARRLGGNSIGLSDWRHTDVQAPDGRVLRITATPARHGPEGRQRGPVIGFILEMKDAPGITVYVSGDTVFYEGVAAIAQRFAPKAAILHLGAARVPEVGPFHLTMTAEEGVDAARAFADAVIVPVHFEGWAHFSEGRHDIERAFAGAGLENRVRWPEWGKRIVIGLPS